MLSAFWGKTPQQAPPPPAEEPKVTYRLVVDRPTVVEEVKEVVPPPPEPEPEVEPEPLAPGEKLVLIGVKVRPDTKKTLGELASLAGVTVSTYVRNVLEKVRR